MTNLPKGPWEVVAESATWDENGDVILKIKITLPQKSISAPEAIAVSEYIARTSILKEGE